MTKEGLFNDIPLPERINYNSEPILKIPVNNGVVLEGIGDTSSNPSTCPSHRNMANITNPHHHSHHSRRHNHNHGSQHHTHDVDQANEGINGNSWGPSTALKADISAESRHVFPAEEDVKNQDGARRTTAVQEGRRRRKFDEAEGKSVGGGFPPLIFMGYVQESVRDCICANSTILKRLLVVLAVLSYHVFLGFAIAHDFKKASNVVFFTGFCWLMAFYYWVFVPLFSKRFNRFVNSTQRSMRCFTDRFLVRVVFHLLVFGLIAAFLVYDTAQTRHRLWGLCGMSFYVMFMFMFSRNPTKIVWRPVIWGFVLQFSMGLCVLRWEWGSEKFNSACHLILHFLEFTKSGTDFVYGFLSAPPNICGMDPVFAFQSIQVVVYFGAIVALMYYAGVMQAVLRKLTWVVQMTLGTTATESFNACACIFLGQSEASLLIRPYLDRMTASELHAVMTTGFSCIAGAVFATYISFGACPRYLLSATLMSAPGSLACSKLLYPETERSQLLHVEDLQLPESEESSALECISNGAVMAVELVLAIVANLIVFLALLALVDAVVSYFGGLVGYPEWNFELFLGCLFFPLAFIMGVNENVGETFRVAQLMGTKTALNEFIAYQKLGRMIDDKLLSPRSAMIATYALCGFSNFTSIGIQLGVLGGMAPTRKRLLSKLVLRALMAGSISCFMTASLAGILIDTPIVCHSRTYGEKCFNVTQYQEFAEKNLADLLPQTFFDNPLSFFHQQSGNSNINFLHTKGGEL